MGNSEYEPNSHNNDDKSFISYYLLGHVFWNY